MNMTRWRWLTAVIVVLSGSFTTRQAEAGLFPFVWDALFGPPGSVASWYGYGPYYGGYPVSYGYAPYSAGYAPYSAGYGGYGCNSCGSAGYSAGYAVSSYGCGNDCNTGCSSGCANGNCGTVISSPGSLSTPTVDPNFGSSAPARTTPDRTTPDRFSRDKNSAPTFRRDSEPDPNDPNWQPREAPRRNNTTDDEFDGADPNSRLNNKVDLGEPVPQRKKPTVDPKDVDEGAQLTPLMVLQNRVAQAPSVMFERMSRVSSFRHGSLVKMAARPTGPWEAPVATSQLASNH